jgi:hypothetical protein
MPTRCNHRYAHAWQDLTMPMHYELSYTLPKQDHTVPHRTLPLLNRTIQTMPKHCDTTQCHCEAIRRQCLTMLYLTSLHNAHALPPLNCAYAKPYSTNARPNSTICTLPKHRHTVPYIAIAKLDVAIAVLYRTRLNFAIATLNLTAPLLDRTGRCLSIAIHAQPCLAIAVQ